MVSLTHLACALTIGMGAAVLFVLPAWIVEQSVEATAESIDKLRIELSKQLDKLHKDQEDYYE